MQYISIFCLVRFWLEGQLVPLLLLEILHELLLLDLAELFVTRQIEWPWESSGWRPLSHHLDIHSRVDTRLQEIVSLRVVDVVISGINGKLVIYSKYLGFSQPLLLCLLLLKLLEFQVPAKAFDDHYLLLVILDARVRLRMEGALVEFFHLSLPPLHGDSLVLLLQLRSNSVLIHSWVTAVQDDAWNALVKPGVLRVRLRLESQLLILFLLVLLLSCLELMLG